MVTKTVLSLFTVLSGIFALTMSFSHASPILTLLALFATAAWFAGRLNKMGR